VVLGVDPVRRTALSRVIDPLRQGSRSSRGLAASRAPQKDKANSESDSQFQEAMLRRLGAVEKELGLDEAGGGMAARLASLEEELK